MVVLGLADGHDLAHAIHMAAQRVAADLGAIFGRALHIQRAALLQAAQGGQPQALLHHVKGGAAGARQAGHRQAHTVAGHAGAYLQAGIKTFGKSQLKAAQAGAVGEAGHLGHALNNAGEHGGAPLKRC